MASNEVVTLPALEPKVRYQGMPRRYEETKPVFVRDLTHRSILRMGMSFHKDTLSRASAEQEFAVKSAEEAVWAQAEVLKKEALETAIKKTQLEHEKVIRKLHKANEKAIKEEALKVSGEMQKMAMEMVKKEHKEGEARLAEAVKATEQKCHQEKVAAVQQAREQERQAAAQRAAQVADQENEKFEAAVKKADEEKEKALSDLRTLKDNEQAVAIAQAHQEEHKKAEQRLEDMRIMYELKLQDLREVISGKNQEILRLEQDLEATIQHKKAIAKELISTRDEFQSFIDKTSPFEKGKSEYLLPPAKSLIRPLERETTMYY